MRRVFERIGWGVVLVGLGRVGFWLGLGGLVECTDLVRCVHDGSSVFVLREKTNTSSFAVLADGAVDFPFPPPSL